MNLNNSKSLIIAMPNASLAEGIKKFIEKQGDYKVIEIVVVLEHLIEQLELLKQEKIKVDGIILSSDISKKQEDKRLEYLSDVLLTIRERHDDSKFMILSNESEGHPFLAELVNMGIYNIFIKEEKGKTIDLQGILQCLIEPIPFSVVSKFRNIDSTIPWRRVYKGTSTINVQLVGQEKGKASESPQIIEKEKIVEKIKVVEKIVEKTVEVKIPEMVTIAPKMIAIGSLYPGSGAKFVSSNLAKALSSCKIPVVVLESVDNEPIWYELLFGAEKAPENWESFAAQIKRNKVVDKKSIWEEDTIIWAPLEPDFETRGWTLEDSFYLISTCKQAPIVLVDIGSEWNTDFNQMIINQSDEIWVVATPSPSKVNTYKKKLQEMDLTKVRMIGNFWDEYIQKREFETEWIESFSFCNSTIELLTRISRYGKEVTEAEWQGKVLYEMLNQSKFQDEIYPLLERLVPLGLLQKFRQKRSSIFSKIIGTDRRKKA